MLQQNICGSHNNSYADLGRLCERFTDAEALDNCRDNRHDRCHCGGCSGHCFPVRKAEKKKATAAAKKRESEACSSCSIHISI